MAIAGHRTTHGAPFNGLGRLGTGDRIILTTTSGQNLTYVVAGAPQVVSPSDVAVLNYFGDNRITLTTCNPEFSSSQRLVVVGKLDLPAAGTPPRHVTYQLGNTATASWNWSLLPVVGIELSLLLLLALFLSAHRQLVRQRREMACPGAAVGRRALPPLRYLDELPSSVHLRSDLGPRELAHWCCRTRSPRPTAVSAAPVLKLHGPRGSVTQSHTSKAAVPVGELRAASWPPSSCCPLAQELIAAGRGVVARDDSRTSPGDDRLDQCALASAKRSRQPAPLVVPPSGGRPVVVVHTQHVDAGSTPQPVW